MGGVSFHSYLLTMQWVMGVLDNLDCELTSF